MNSSTPGAWSADGYPDRGPAVFAVTTGTLVLATVFVTARLACRTFIVRQVTWDDYFIIIAWALAFGLSFAIDYGTSKGLGRHDANIKAEDWDALRRSEYTFTVLYNPALMAFKTSVLVFYLRLSKNTQKVLRLASWAVLAIVNLAGTVLTLLNIFQCSPVDAAFNRNPGTCIPLLTEFICSAPVNIVTDLAILALPLPVLTSMRLPPRQKIILIMTFALGIFVTIVDVIRIYYLQKAINDAPTISPSNDPSAVFGGSPEFSWNASLALLWSAVEVNVGIACACIPTLKPLIIRILPAMLIDPDGSGRRASETADKTPTVRSYSHEPTTTAPSTAHTEPATPNLTHQRESTLDEQISALEFLTTPDMVMEGSPERNRRPTLSNTATTGSLDVSGVYFGFVNMRKPKSMIRTSVKDSLKYCTIVSILFLLWGFSYGLLNTLSNVVAEISNMTVPETLGLTSIYFGAGYFFGPLLVGEWILRHDEHRRLEKRRRNSAFDDRIGGFKATFMLGLCIYGTGTIIFWPSAVLSSFPGFLISNFVVGFGLAVLETAANPFIALCGPMDYAEMRLLLSQGVQAVATVISGVLAQKVFFARLSTRSFIGASTLIDVQWTFLAITLLCVGLALFFYYMPLPEVTDAEMENSTRYLPIDPKKRSFFGFQLRTWSLALAVLAQWTYVASQEIMSIFFRDILTPRLNAPPGAGLTNVAESRIASDADGLSISTTDYLLIAHAAFALSRFLAAYLAYLSPTHPKIPQPRTILNLCTGCSIISGVIVSALRPTNPNLLVIPVVIFFFFEGPMWPLIYTLGLRGQGKRTKRAAAFITIGASGPAFWPFVVYGIHQGGASYQTAFALVPALLVVSGFFSLFLDLKRDARALVDARIGPEQQQKIQDRANREMELDAIIAARRRASVNGLNEFDSPFLDQERSTFIKRLTGTWLKNQKGSEPSATGRRESKSSSSG